MTRLVQCPSCKGDAGPGKPCDLCCSAGQVVALDVLDVPAFNAAAATVYQHGYAAGEHDAGEATRSQLSRERAAALLDLTATLIRFAQGACDDDAPATDRRALVQIAIDALSRTPQVHPSVANALQHLRQLVPLGRVLAEHGEIKSHELAPALALVVTGLDALGGYR
jgi:hypothetical protein